MSWSSMTEPQPKNDGPDPVKAEVEIRAAKRQLEIDRDSLTRRESELEQRERAASDVALSLREKESRQSEVDALHAEKVQGLERELASERQAAKNAVASYEQDIAALQSRLQHAEAAIQSVSNERTAAVDDRQHWQQEFENLRNEAQQVYARLEETEARLNAVVAENEELRRHLS